MMIYYHFLLKVFELVETEDGVCVPQIKWAPKNGDKQNKTNKQTNDIKHNYIITNTDSEQCGVCVCVQEYKKYSGIGHKIQKFIKDVFDQ